MLRWEDREKRQESDFFLWEGHVTTQSHLAMVAVGGGRGLDGGESYVYKD